MVEQQSASTLRAAVVLLLSLSLLLTIPFAQAFQSLNGVRVTPVVRPPDSSKGRDEQEGTTAIDIGQWLQQGNAGEEKGRSMVIFGTYAADFNAIEYGQRLRYYWPELKQSKNIKRCAFLLSCRPKAALSLTEKVDLPDDIELWVDNTGEAAREFGVERGWLPENDDVNPFLKLFGMLWGLGAWATLPAVIGGYIGNPFVPQPWIEDALAVGQKQKRWPDNALEIDDDGTIHNKFKELPVVGSWPRRPLELATLRLQSMLGISLKSWDELAPDGEALDAGVLTQLGGCLIVDENGNAIYEWRDPGICAVANFEDIMKKI